MKNHMKLDVNESHALIGCLLRAADVGGGPGNAELPGMARYLADLIIEKWTPREPVKIEVPEDYVPTDTQAHALSLLTIWEAAKLLDMRIPDLALEAGAGHIDIAARCNNVPCFSLPAIDAYRRRRHPRASS
jgi:hypothetical protein